MGMPRTKDLNTVPFTSISMLLVKVNKLIRHNDDGFSHAMLLLQGYSTDPKVIEQVKEAASKAKKVMVLLDSGHSDAIVSVSHTGKQHQCSAAALDMITMGCWYGMLHVAQGMALLTYNTWGTVPLLHLGHSSQ